MISPTIGRVVWYYPVGALPSDQPLPALVAHVWGDRCVNLAIFDANGVPYPKPPTSIPLVQDGDTPPTAGNYCTWMPYQIGQAKTHGPANHQPKSST